MLKKLLHGFVINLIIFADVCVSRSYEIHVNWQCHGIALFLTPRSMIHLLVMTVLCSRFWVYAASNRSSD